jgi:hypothetical protein
MRLILGYSGVSALNLIEGVTGNLTRATPIPLACECKEIGITDVFLTNVREAKLC